MWHSIRSCRPHNTAAIGRKADGEELQVICNYQPRNGDGSLPPLITYHQVIDELPAFRYPPVEITHWRPIPLDKEYEMRARWNRLKEAIGAEMFRLHEMLREASDGRDPSDHFLAAGQQVPMGSILSSLGIAHLVPHGEGGFIAEKDGQTWPSVWWESAEVFWREIAQKTHCPLTLSEADNLLTALFALTPDGVRAALVQASSQD